MNLDLHDAGVGMHVSVYAHLKKSLREQRLQKSRKMAQIICPNNPFCLPQVGYANGYTMNPFCLSQVGYSNGYTTNPFYREVCSEKTGHTEVVRVVFDPDVIPYVDLLRMFWENHDPTQGMRQRADKGTRYRSGIYCYGSEQKDLATQSRDLYAEVLRKNEFKREITTEIESAGEFYYAEDYHQQYLFKDEGSHCPLMGGTGYACPIGLLKPGTPEHK